MRIRIGDILVFYKSSSGKLTTIGTVDHISEETNINEVLNLVLKRTVYSQAQLAVMLQKRTKVILFLHNFHLKHPIYRTVLKRIGISPPRSIIEIDDTKYQNIKKLGHVDPRLTVQ